MYANEFWQYLNTPLGNTEAQHSTTAQDINAARTDRGSDWHVELATEKE